MKPGVLLSLAGVICLLTGFFTFLYGRKDISLFFTLCGCGVYIYKQIKKKEQSA